MCRGLGYRLACSGLNLRRAFATSDSSLQGIIQASVETDLSELRLQSRLIFQSCGFSQNSVRFLKLAISDGGLGQNLGRALCCYSPLTRLPGTLCRTFCISPGLELYMSTLKTRARSCKLFIVSYADVQNWPKSSFAQLPIPILLANLFQQISFDDCTISIFR